LLLLVALQLLLLVALLLLLALLLLVALLLLLVALLLLFVLGTEGGVSPGLVFLAGPEVSGKKDKEKIIRRGLCTPCRLVNRVNR
jgi:hypothetical protein